MILLLASFLAVKWEFGVSSWRMLVLKCLRLLMPPVCSAGRAWWVGIPAFSVCLVSDEMVCWLFRWRCVHSFGTGNAAPRGGYRICDMQCCCSSGRRALIFWLRERMRIFVAWRWGSLFKLVIGFTVPLLLLNRMIYVSSHIYKPCFFRSKFLIWCKSLFTMFFDVLICH